jgi:hypothetical protein
MTLRLITAPVQELGTTPHGKRIVYPIIGGEFEGPRLRGKVLPGGGDWVVTRADGALELDMRTALETDDGALIYMTFEGLRHAPPEVAAALGRGEAVDPSTYYFRTVPRFATAAPKYASSIGSSRSGAVIFLPADRLTRSRKHSERASRYSLGEHA